MPYFTTPDSPSETGPDNRQYAAATDRNREPILAVLKEVLPSEGTVLEIASGTGQHAAYFAPQLGPRYWLPSDPQSPLRHSIQAWRVRADAPTLLPPIEIDAASSQWAIDLNQDVPAITAVVNINMIHISPWQAGLGLLAGAGRLLPPGGVLYLYGPYQRDGQHTAPSNAEFDRWLRSQNPDWGVRNLETVAAAALSHHLQLDQVIEMPANNLSLVFKR